MHCHKQHCRYQVVRWCLYLAENESFSSIKQSALRQFHGFFQSQFSTQCDLVLPLSIYGSCLHFLHPPPLTSILPSIFPSTACFRRQFLRKVWPIRLAFIQFAVPEILLSSLTLCKTSFLTRSVQLNFSILLQRQISKPSSYF